jgi:hypothetical protein
VPNSIQASVLHGEGKKPMNTYRKPADTSATVNTDRPNSQKRPLNVPMLCHLLDCIISLHTIDVIRKLENRKGEEETRSKLHNFSVQSKDKKLISEYFSFLHPAAVAQFVSSAESTARN